MYENSLKYRRKYSAERKNVTKKDWNELLKCLIEMNPIVKNTYDLKS